MLCAKTFGFVSSAFNAHALGALAEVAGPGLDFHLSTIVPALLAAMGDDNMVWKILSLLSLTNGNEGGNVGY